MRETVAGAELTVEVRRIYPRWCIPIDNFVFDAARIDKKSSVNRERALNPAGPAYTARHRALFFPAEYSRLGRDVPAPLSSRVVPAESTGRMSSTAAETGLCKEKSKEKWCEEGITLFCDRMKLRSV